MRIMLESLSYLVRVVSELWRKLISLFDSLKARLVCVSKSHRKCG